LPGGEATTCFRLTIDDPDATRIRADYHRTLVELYEENFVAVCQRWAAARSVPFRIQGYGTPPARISSYRFADLFEGEGWGWKDITETRWASSAAHLYRPVVSAEVWTWVHSPSFRATPLDLKGEAHEHLLNGVGRRTARREARRRIPRAIPKTIRTVGLDYDLIDDDALAVTPAARYRVIIVPTATMIPKATAGWLDQVRASGGTVLPIESGEGLAGALLAVIGPDLTITPASSDIGFVHRRCRETEVYLVANTGPTTATFRVLPRTNKPNYERWDALSGRVICGGAASGGIDLTLHPYAATVIVLTDHMRGEPVEARPSTSSGRKGVSSGRKGVSSGRIPLSGTRQVAFGNEPARSVELPHIWENEPGRQHYSGAATYGTSVDLSTVDGPGMDRSGQL
jgi:hypothetical protein